MKSELQRDNAHSQRRYVYTVVGWLFYALGGALAVMAAATVSTWAALAWASGVFFVAGVIVVISYLAEST